MTDTTHSNIEMDANDDEVKKNGHHHHHHWKTGHKATIDDLKKEIHMVLNSILLVCTYPVIFCATTLPCRGFVLRCRYGNWSCMGMTRLHF